MNSITWDDQFNSGIKLLDCQHRNIFNCMTEISHVISDSDINCDSINGLLDQLLILCNLHFEYERILMGELNYSSVTMHKDLHDSFISSIVSFKIDDNQCHTLNCLNDFLTLRLDFITILLDESKMLADFIEHKSSNT
ncbi:MAG: hypothetical protein HXX11_15115 [Desulfuromonadales bacterium]|nr:hypothetical protein [Desulfuromonadales bacterium]